MSTPRPSQTPSDTAEPLPRRPGPVTRVRGWRVDRPGAPGGEERVATEEPLEVRVDARRVAVTMRTPGHDFELAVGWLAAEGVVARPDQVRAVRYCTDEDLAAEQVFNTVTVDLADPAAAAGLVTRSFVVSSACGVCGRDSVADLVARLRPLPPPGDTPALDPALLAVLPDRLREHQRVFAATGGLHAAGLFDARDGSLLALREDVGRHNAVDKVLGWALLDGRWPLTGAVLVVSGRTSFEIAQKTLAAGVPALVAVSAPSSLAVEVAQRAGLTLCGFVRDGRVTVYAGRDRVSTAEGAPSPG